MNERKLLLGWKRITEYTGISRLLMIRYAYPVHDCDRATRVRRMRLYRRA